MQTIDEVREHCRFVGKGIENTTTVSGRACEDIAIVVRGGSPRMARPTGYAAKMAVFPVSANAASTRSAP